jgi:hypothetical protein
MGNVVVAAVGESARTALATVEALEELRQIADERCPGAYCVRNAIPLATRVVAAGEVS